MPVRKNFSVNKGGYRKQTIEIVLRGFCLFSFSNFTFGFHLKKLKLIQLNFELAPAEENLVVNNKDNRVFMSRNFPLGNLMFLKLAHLQSKLHFSGKYLF